MAKLPPMALKGVAKLLGVQYYKIHYALETGAVPEPTRISNRRIFEDKDIRRLAEHFGVEVPETAGTQG